MSGKYNEWIKEAQRKITEAQEARYGRNDGLTAFNIASYRIDAKDEKEAVEIFCEGMENVTKLPD